MTVDHEPYRLAGKRVWVAGHKGMVGRALVRRLASESCDILAVDRADLDLTDQTSVRQWIAAHRPEAVFLAAAKVGGIMANARFPAAFLYDNLMIEANIIDAAYRNGVEKLLFLGSSCIYPKHAPQPIPEEALMTGALEPTNEAYAIAKIAGITLVQSYRKQYGANFIAAMPTNLYGPGDDFDLHSGHVVPALIRKVHEAMQRKDREVVIWGTGQPRREFLHVDDCADACVHLMKTYVGQDPVNVGSGKDMTIAELAALICEVIGFDGTINHDLEKPDGTPQKLLNVEKLKGLGWTASIPLRQGLAATYQWFVEQENSLRC
jgi:GDP-L-fucose synthase